MNYPLFSQQTLDINFFDYDYKRARRLYEFTRNELYNDSAARLLMGDIAILDEKLSIFALARVNKPVLRILRNMIYAKYNYIFQSPDLARHFSIFDWYNPSSRNVDHLFTEIDKYNLNLIRSFEEMDETIPDIMEEKDYIGYWNSMPYFGAGPGERFIMGEGNTILYGASSMRELRLLQDISGTYEIKGNVLEFQITNITFYIHNSIFEVSFAGNQWKDMKAMEATFNGPIIYKLPITVPVEEPVIDHSRVHNRDKLDVIRIGNVPYYRIPDVPSHYY
jgi:hypothetical protein